MRKVLLCILALCLVACGDDNGVGSESWQCDVTLTLIPSRINNVSSPSGSGRGTGSGGSRDEALRAAFKQACAGLNLDAATRRRCEAGEDFVVYRTLDGIRLGSAVDRLQRCSGGT